MNPIEMLKMEIERRFRSAKTILTKPHDPAGVWLLEVELESKELDIEWNQRHGFGVTSSANSHFGMGADEAYKEVKEATARVLHLISTGEATSSPIGLKISRLRESLGVTQKALAEKLAVSQVTISGIEKRSDIQVSTLKRIAAGLNGQLRIGVIIENLFHPLVGNSLSEPKETTSATNASGVSDSIKDFPKQDTSAANSYPRLARSNQLSRSIGSAERIRNRRHVLCLNA